MEIRRTWDLEKGTELELCAFGDTLGPSDHLFLRDPCLLLAVPLAVV